jgi:hypothetical protein
MTDTRLSPSGPREGLAFVVATEPAPVRPVADGETATLSSIPNQTEGALLLDWSVTVDAVAAGGGGISVYLVPDDPELPEVLIDGGAFTNAAETVNRGLQARNLPTAGTVELRVNVAGDDRNISGSLQVNQFTGIRLPPRLPTV